MKCPLGGKRLNDKIIIESEFFDFCSGCGEIEPQLKTSKLFGDEKLCLCDIVVTCAHYEICKRLAEHVKEETH